jgi:glycosyltransferase involved in cell wall biosynthesis
MRAGPSSHPGIYAARYSHTGTEFMIIGVVTPSYLRMKFLRRFLRLMPLQTFRDWRLVVVHDGPNPEAKALVERATARDPRIAYAHTEGRSNNYGVTPRLEGLRYMIREVGADYCVLWDDDNYFSLGALKWIAGRIEAAGQPDLLLVPIRYEKGGAPPKDVPVEKLDYGQVDTGCIVIKPQLAVEGYEEMLRTGPTDDPKYYFTQDLRLFQYVRDERREAKIAIAHGRWIGIHDGLRIGMFIRSTLGIPRLGILPYFFRRDVYSK